MIYYTMVKMMINCWISGAPNCWTNQTMGLVSADESAIRAFATCPCKRWAAEKLGKRGQRWDTGSTEIGYRNDTPIKRCI
jgi:hypothetical protein